MEQRAKAAEHGMPRTLDTTLSRWFSAAYQLKHPEKVALMRDWLIEDDPIVHAWSWRAIRDLDFVDGLRKLAMPAMAVAGLDDQSTPVATMKAMAADIPGALYREIDSAISRRSNNQRPSRPASGKCWRADASTTRKEPRGNEAAPFGYHDPRRSTKQSRCLARLENARLLAGGQSLMPMMNFRYAMPDHLIDLNGVAKLDAIDIGEGITLGAMTRQRAIEFFAELRGACPFSLRRCSRRPSADAQSRHDRRLALPSRSCGRTAAMVLLRYDAELTAQGRTARATHAASPNFALGYMTTALEPDEMLTGVRFPRWPQGPRLRLSSNSRAGTATSRSLARRCCSRPTRSGTITRASLTSAASRPAPVRLRDAEATLSVSGFGHARSRRLRPLRATRRHVGRACQRRLPARISAAVLTRRAIEAAMRIARAAAHEPIADRSRLTVNGKRIRARGQPRADCSPISCATNSV